MYIPTFCIFKWFLVFNFLYMKILISNYLLAYATNRLNENNNSLYIIKVHQYKTNDYMPQKYFILLGFHYSDIYK